MKLSQILPNFKKAERASFLGAAGSGKTTLAEAITRICPYSVVLDTKHDLDWKGFTVFYDLEKMIKKPAERNLFRPERGFERDAAYELQTRLFEWIWHRKHTTIYIDEATQISSSTQICPSLFDLITRGRSRGIAVYSGSQRPSGLKQEFLSEADNIYCFALRLPADKEKVFKFGNVVADLITAKNNAEKSRHYFIYSKNGSVSQPMILKQI